MNKVKKNTSECYPDKSKLLKTSVSHKVHRQLSGNWPKPKYFIRLLRTEVSDLILNILTYFTFTLDATF